MDSSPELLDSIDAYRSAFGVTTMYEDVNFEESVGIDEVHSLFEDDEPLITAAARPLGMDEITEHVTYVPSTQSLLFGSTKYVLSVVGWLERNKAKLGVEHMIQLSGYADDVDPTQSNWDELFSKIKNGIAAAMPAIVSEHVTSARKVAEGLNLDRSGRQNELTRTKAANKAEVYVRVDGLIAGMAPIDCLAAKGTPRFKALQRRLTLKGDVVIGTRHAFVSAKSVLVWRDSKGRERNTPVRFLQGVPLPGFRGGLLSLDGLMLGTAHIEFDHISARDELARDFRPIGSRVVAGEGKSATTYVLGPASAIILGTTPNYLMLSVVGAQVIGATTSITPRLESSGLVAFLKSEKRQFVVDPHRLLFDTLGRSMPWLLSFARRTKGGDAIPISATVPLGTSVYEGHFYPHSSMVDAYRTVSTFLSQLKGSVAESPRDAAALLELFDTHVATFNYLVTGLVEYSLRGEPLNEMVFDPLLSNTAVYSDEYALAISKVMKPEIESVAAYSEAIYRMSLFFSYNSVQRWALSLASEG